MKIFTESTDEDRINMLLGMLTKAKQPETNLIKMHWFKTPATKTRKYYYTAAERKLTRGEQVIIDLDTLETCSIRLINEILYSNKGYKFNVKDKKGKDKTIYNTNHHIVYVIYGGKTYKLDSIEEWKHSYQSDNDVNRMSTFKHKILQDFENKSQILKERHIKDVAESLYQRYATYIKDIPVEIDMDTLIDTYGKLYHIYNSNDPVEKLRNYIQIKFYVEHDIEPDPMTDEQIELSIGNSAMLDDFIYKFSQAEN